MGTSHGAYKFTRKPDGWVTRLFDYKPFLVFLCMLPTIGLLVVFLTYPLGLGIWLSLTDTTIGQPGQFIGLDNFVDLMGEGLAADLRRPAPRAAA